MKFIDKYKFILTLSNETELSVDEATELIIKRQMLWNKEVYLKSQEIQEDY